MAAWGGLTESGNANGPPERAAAGIDVETVYCSRIHVWLRPMNEKPM